MSQANIPVFSELFFRRDRATTEMRAMEGDIRGLVQRMNANVIRVPVMIEDRLTKGVTALVEKNSLGNEVIIPVRYDGKSLLDGATAVQRVNKALESEEVVIPVRYQTMGSPGTGGGTDAGGDDTAGADDSNGGFLKGALSRRGMMSALIAIHGVNQLATAWRRNYDDTDINSTEDLNGQLAQRRAKLEASNSGLGYLAQKGWAKLGIQDSYEQQTSELNEAERESKIADRRGQAARQFIPMQNRMQDQQTMQSGGQFAVDLQQLNRSVQEMEKTAREAGGGNISKAVQAQIDQYSMTQTSSIAIARQRQISQAVLSQGESGIAGNVSDMIASGQGRTAAIYAQKQAINSRLSSEKINADTELDPTKRKELQDQYNADFAAGEKQKTAIEAEESRKRQREAIQSADVVNDAKSRSYVSDLQTQQNYHEASVKQQNDAVDRRVRLAQEAADAETDAVKKVQLQQEASAEQAEGVHQKQLIAARELQRIADQTADHMMALDRARLSVATEDYQLETRIFNEEWDKRIADADVKDKELLRQERDAQQQARDARHKENQASQLQQDRDIVLRAQGRGNLAQELDIEDELKRSLRAAGNDPQARNLALANTRAQLFGFLRGEQRPQIFGGFEQFDQSMQEQVFNRDASAVKRAMSLNKFIGENGKDISTGKTKIPGEDDPASDFTDAATTFDGAVDKFVKSGQIVVVVK